MPGQAVVHRQRTQCVTDQPCLARQAGDLCNLAVGRHASLRHLCDDSVDQLMALARNTYLSHTRRMSRRIFAGGVARLKNILRHGTSEEVALHIAATLALEEVPLRLGLYTFRHNVETQR